jgi:hypothetical protein
MILSKDLISMVCGRRATRKSTVTYFSHTNLDLASKESG